MPLIPAVAVAVALLDAVAVAVAATAAAAPAFDWLPEELAVQINCSREGCCFLAVVEEAVVVSAPPAAVPVAVLLLGTCQGPIPLPSLYKGEEAPASKCEGPIAESLAAAALLGLNLLLLVVLVLLGAFVLLLRLLVAE
jgi:hypothetical protein